jgi:PAS domain S-box-containing protein
MVFLADFATVVPWLLAGISAIVVALAGAVAHLWRQNSQVFKSQIDQREVRIKALEASEKKDKAEIEDLKKRVQILELERERLDARFLHFKSSHDACPLPVWFKDRDGTMLSCNRAYETVFLKPRGYCLEDYLGKQDKDVWPPAIAQKFEENDRKVLDSGEVHDQTEMVENRHGVLVAVRIIKYPRRLLGVSEPVGVAGMAIVEDLKGLAFNSHE